MAMASRFGFLLQTQLTALPLRSQPFLRSAFTTSNFLQSSGVPTTTSFTHLTQLRLLATVPKSAPAKKEDAKKVDAKKTDKKKASGPATPVPKSAPAKKVNAKKVAAPAKKVDTKKATVPIKKTDDKAKIAAQKEKEKAKAAVEKEKAHKEKEKVAAKEKAQKEKAKAAALKEKEKEKLAANKEKEKIQKEKAKAAALKEKEKEKAKALAARKIPRAPSAYNLFVKSAFNGVKKENPGLDFGGVSKILREQWAEAAEATKQPFIKLAREALETSREKREALKKPATGYALYVKENYPSYQKRSPEAKLQEITKQLADAWKGLPPSEMARYKKVPSGSPKAKKA